MINYKSVFADFLFSLCYVMINEEVFIMFDIKDDDIQAVIDSVVVSKDPLVFKIIPAKEKKKYIILCMIIHFFKKDVEYSEKEINAILKPMFDDYVMMRRYLVDYDFINRTTDGKAYWLVADQNDYIRFKISK